MPIKAVNDTVMYIKIHAMPRIRNMHNFKQLRLHQWLFLDRSREYSADVFASKDGQCVINECMQPIGT
jgi:hypothetical protein